MYQASIPLILVGTKCDTAQKTWQVTTRTVDILLSKYEKVESFQTALRSPETHKRCISVMLRNIMLRRHGERKTTVHASTNPLTEILQIRHSLCRSSVGHVQRQDCFPNRHTTRRAAQSEHSNTAGQSRRFRALASASLPERNSPPPTT